MHHVAGVERETDAHPAVSAHGVEAEGEEDDAIEQTGRHQEPCGLDNEELLEFLGQHGLSDDGEAGDIIMAARAHWFEDEDAAGAAEAKEVAHTGDQPAVSDS